MYTQVVADLVVVVQVRTKHRLLARTKLQRGFQLKSTHTRGETCIADMDQSRISTIITYQL